MYFTHIMQHIRSTTSWPSFLTRSHSSHEHSVLPRLHFHTSSACPLESRFLTFAQSSHTSDAHSMQRGQELIYVSQFLLYPMAHCSLSNTPLTSNQIITFIKYEQIPMSNVISTSLY